MLQVMNLTKIYKPKKGVPVRALDNVTLTFPQTGMVFLLGKSGSGKSTLLNILGGLDRYNSGDILIQGKSTRKFRQSHFDSYRNTYVGFIFQEYNILDEFSVGTNIALALQLQGHKADDAQINGILKTVDLEGYGNRKPNELSGGQKQRVAIARALVKNPKIIMADEPTGALDSATGRQVLTTLKKLSRDKLVIVVSHDREFAEQYADRIIELSDGRVIRDVEKLSDGVDTENAVPVYMDDSVSLPEYYHLTEEDRAAICDYIQNMVSVGKTPKFSILGKGNAAFQPTDSSRILLSQEGYKLIKSRLPLKYAFKLGASGLKYKKFRLVMTILLSCIALVMFGLADTVASYHYATTAHRSLVDSRDSINYATFEKTVEQSYGDYTEWVTVSLTQKDVNRIEKETGLHAYPVYRGGGSWGNSFDNHLGEVDYRSFYQIVSPTFGGFIETDQEVLDTMNARLVAGSLPREGTDQIAVSTVVLDMFQQRGYRESYDNAAQKIRTGEDLIGKKLKINNVTFTICGIVDTGVDMDRYQDLTEQLIESYSSDNFADQISLMFFETEMRYSMNYSLTGLGMIAPGSSTRLLVSEMQDRQISLQGDNFYFNEYSAEMLSGELNPETVFCWLDGQPRTTLKENEVVLTEDMLWNYYQDQIPVYEDGTVDFSAVLGMRLKLELTGYIYDRMGMETVNQSQELTLVGVAYQENSGQIFVSAKMLERDGQATICQTLSPMPEKSGEIKKLVDFSDEVFRDNADSLRYNMMNPVTFELRTLDEVFEILEKVFFWVGIVFVVFSSLLFSNFIAVSISYKKEQIGILRAIGSRSNDVFRIFFAESFCIAMINYGLSLAGTVGICALLNSMMKSGTGLMLTVLNVGIRQVLLLLVICLAVAAVASFVPVKKIAAKKPIDAIRDR